MCHFPVAQDGTCNGLQHYAALGGDEMGARQVNLQPSDRPQDVYTGVADLVNAQVDKDAAEGHEIAKMVQGHIARKVVKQSVMTNVYGVTFIGARQQIQNQLEDNKAISKEYLTRCASYIAKLVFGSISTMFGGATQIQHWLANSAKIISRSAGPSQLLLDKETDKTEEEVGVEPRKKKSAKDEDVEGGVKPKKKTTATKKEPPRKIEFMSSVIWTTPLGMPIVQPYRNERTKNVQTNLQRVQISDPSAIEQVNSRKQMTAFPPNFIHSLDATHMLLSATKCAEQGLTFASVHDSFWTHPSDVDELNRILRDAFVKIHSDDIMGTLKREFETRYAGYRYLVPLKSNKELYKQVRELRARYAVEVLQQKKAKTISLFDEFMWEMSRDELLKSDDPELRAKGEAMVTPSVLVERLGGVEALADPKTESPGPGLGETTGEDPSTVAEVGETGAAITKKKKKKGSVEAAVFDADEGSDPDAEIIIDEDEAGEDAEGEDPVEKALNLEEDAVVKEFEAELEENEVEKALKQRKAKAAKSSVKSSEYVWMPLKFPELPPKVWNNSYPSLSLCVGIAFAGQLLTSVFLFGL